MLQGQSIMSEQKLQTPSLKDELSKAVYEPLLPVEMKLIGWSLGTGIVLLVLLAILNRYWA
jgi:hypothetical protein